VVFVPRQVVLTELNKDKSEVRTGFDIFTDNGNSLNMGPATNYTGGLTIDGTNTGDTLTLDLSHDNPILSGGLTFNAGAGNHGTLAIVNGSATTETFDYTTAHSGDVKLDGKTINYTGLSPVTSSITATDVSLDYTAASNTITVTNPSAGNTEVTSNNGEDTTFADPTSTLSISATGGGTNAFNINSLDSSYPAALTLTGGTGDTVNFGGTISLASTLSVTAGAVTQTGGTTLTVSGTATFTEGTSGDITLDSAFNSFSTVAITSGINVTFRSRARSAPRRPSRTSRSARASRSRYTISAIRGRE
jgi:hypothetical protein